MLYDDNGAIVRDLDRNILSIQNNLLSLPSEITFDNGNKIFHYYDATGQRYRTESVTYQWTGVARPAGTGNSGTSQSTLTTINNITHINDNVVYKQLNSGPITLSRANNPEGYVAPTIRERGDGIDASLRHGMSFCYYIKDHIGNTRKRIHIQQLKKIEYMFIGVIIMVICFL